MDFKSEPTARAYVQDENMAAGDQRLYVGTTDECSICKAQLQKILTASKEKAVSEGGLIKLKEGYELII